MHSETRRATNETVSGPICGIGEMAERIRAFPWDTTPLGAIAFWPSELIFAVNQMLCSPLPGLVFWGKEFIGLYNDAFLPAYAGRHPWSLGQPARVVWSELWPQIGAQLETVFREGTTVAFQKQPFTVTVAGEQRQMYWDYAYTPIRNSRGDILGVYEVAQDVTFAVESVANLRASETRSSQLVKQLNAIQDATTDSILSIDRNWTVTYLNGAARAATGPLADAVGKNFWEQYPDTVYEGSPYVENYQRAMDQGIEGEFEAFYPEPLNIWVEVRVRPTADGIVLFFRDVTTKKKEEALLQSTAERLQLAQAAGLISAWDWDLATGEIVWTESELTYGRAPEDVNTAEKCFSFIYSDDVELVHNALGPALESIAEYQCEFRVVWPDQSCKWVTARGRSSFPDASNKPCRILGVQIDITDQKLAEAALLQNEKLAAVGRLASSIAHEINNPLEAVTNLLYLAGSSDAMTDVRSYLSQAERELRRVSLIANQTLRFHKQSTSPREVSCTDLFGDVLAIYQGRLLNSGIEIEKRKRAHRSVECFDGEIRQVLTNLIGNAIDAMHGTGGRLLVRSREAHNWSTGQEGIVLTVADTGTGMPPKVLCKIFDAFYTTKGIGGTGLGLWVSRDIVERHRGVLRVRRMPGIVAPCSHYFCRSKLSFGRRGPQRSRVGSRTCEPRLFLDLPARGCWYRHILSDRTAARAQRQIVPAPPPTIGASLTIQECPTG